MPLQRLGDYLSQALWNSNMEALEASAALNVGRGILSGCELSAGDGLNVVVSEGTLHGAGSAVKITAPLTYTVPASGSYSLWFNCSSQALSHSASTTDPGEPVVCLGRVTTSGTVITSIATTGRVGLMRADGSGGYVIGDGAITLGHDGSIQAAGAVAVSGGMTVAGGVMDIQKRMSSPVNIQSISANLTLDSDAPNIQVITPSTSGLKVILPSVTDWGTEWTVHNTSAVNSLLVRNSSDTLTLATVAALGKAQIIPSVSPSGGTTPSMLEKSVAEATPVEGEPLP